jgi:transcriptional regulator with XRE-family HTH domain
MKTGKDRIARIASKASAATTRYVRKSIDIADRISMILESQGKTQKDLAQALGKSESEISKWLGGQHNFTVRTLTAVEDALGENIFVVPEGKRQEKYYSGSLSAGDVGRMVSAGQVNFNKLLTGLDFSMEGTAMTTSKLAGSLGFAKKKGQTIPEKMIIVA